MTRLEDMSAPERRSWITFLADGAVFLYFWQAMTGGFSLRPVDLSPEGMGRVTLGVIVVTVIVHTAIAIIFEARRNPDGHGKDERDVEIAMRGSQWGYSILQIGLGVILVTAILEYLSEDDNSILISVNSPTEMIFALMFLSYAADLIKHGMMIWAYRRI